MYKNDNDFIAFSLLSLVLSSDASLKLLVKFLLKLRSFLAREDK